MFGCKCFFHTRTGGKLDPRALKCVFVGYSPTHKDYKYYHPPSRKYFVSMEFRLERLNLTSVTSSGEDNEREEMIPSPITLERFTLEETTIRGRLLVIRKLLYRRDY